MSVSEDQVREALRPVRDPEIGMSIVDLGLVRDIEISNAGRHVEVLMTLTTPFCPEGPFIVAAAQQAVRRLPGVEQGKVELVWSPPWDPRSDCSEDVRAELGIWD